MENADILIAVKLWIELSQSDLKSSRILYLAGQHHNSYFLFQQAVEKANKAFALYLGFTEKELKEIGHDQMKIYKKVIADKKTEVQELINDLDRFPDFKDHTLMKPFNFHEYHQTLLTSLATIQNLKNEDLVYLSIEDIDYLLDEIEEVEFAEIELPDPNDPAFRELLANVSNLMAQIPNKKDEMTKAEFDVHINSEQGIQFVNKVVRYGIKLTYTIGHIEAAFVICAFFTIQHSSRTRYFDGSHNPLKLYTKRLPLVRKQEIIMDVFERAVHTFKRHLNIKPFTP